MALSETEIGMIFGWRFGTRGTRRAVIADPSLRQRAGHPFHAARAVASAAADAGLRAVVLGSAQADAAAQSGLRFERRFGRALYDRSDWSKAGYEAGAALLASEMARGIGRRAPSTAAIVMPTCEQMQLRAIGTLIAQGIVPRTVPILGWLLLPPRWDADPAGGAELQLDEYRDALAAIETARGGPGAIWLCCETAALRDIYDGLPGAELRVAALPSLVRNAGPGRAEPGPVDCLHFVVVGHATASKGYELLPDALATVLAADDRLRFTIHGVVDGAGNDAANEILAALRRLGPRVTVLTGGLASTDYFALVRSADVLLLPYRMPDYRDRGSGIFNESQHFGIPVIAPAGSAFARDAINDRRAIALREHSSAALAEAIDEAARNLAELRSNCRRRLTIDNERRRSPVLDDFLRLAAGAASSSPRRWA